MSFSATQKETPACGGRRAGDAISGGVRGPFCQPGLTTVKHDAEPGQEAEWLA